MLLKETVDAKNSIQVKDCLMNTKLEDLICNIEDVIRNLQCLIIYIYIFSMPGRPVRFGGFRDSDKENHGPSIPQVHEDDSDEEDGHILYREEDDEPLEEEGERYYNLFVLSNYIYIVFSKMAIYPFFNNTCIIFQIV